MTTYTELHLYKSISQLRERPIERPKHNFEDEYEALKQERDALEREIRDLKDEIAAEKDEFAIKYDALVSEQQEITDIKCQETNDLRLEIQKVKSEIQELKNWTSATDKLDDILKDLTSQTETVEKQEQLFIDEISRYTRALIELGTSSSTTGNELLLTSSRLPKFRGSNQKEAALLAQSLYSLRMVLVKRYAESLQSGCSVQ